jgi:hypothetical protein
MSKPLVTRRPGRLNPLRLIDPRSPAAFNDCRDLAALVVRMGQDKCTLWEGWKVAAEVWIGAMIAFVVCFAGDEEANLQSVRELLTDPQKMEAAIKMMIESDAWDGRLSRLGHMLTWFTGRELASSLATANRFMAHFMLGEMGR